MVTRIHFHTKFGVGINFPERRDFVKTRVGIILSLVIGAIWCFGFFGRYADAEDLIENHLRKEIIKLEENGDEKGARETRIFLEGIIQYKKGTYPKYISIKKKPTVEGNLRKEIIKLEENGDEKGARATEYRLKRIIRSKREYSEEITKEERERQNAISQKHLEECFPIKPRIKQNKSNEWDDEQMIAFGVSSLLYAWDLLIQTVNMPGRSEPPIKSVSDEQRARMSAEEIIEAYKYTEYQEENNMPFLGLGWWTGKDPNDGEVVLFYFASTAVWFAACHFGPILYDKACEKLPAIRDIVPDIIENNIRDIMLGTGIANHSYWVLSNLRVTNKGIAISHEF